uniref:Ferritin n=1 Tax=Rhizochromulina marina TaxID=1034831 RepID=A0A7S2W0Q2_9STRA|mmetsp:Transcript_10360/g.29598  ORF Transcript_10360/g.29598 Transcript_10360/m.29598 type:complete len:195 (+) Transcript_10360:34-618(+)
MRGHVFGLLSLLAVSSSVLAASRARRDFTESSEVALNDHINVEYSASYQYQALWAYFNRDDVALLNIAEFFKKMSKEEAGHAREFQEYMNLRGGQVVLQDVQAPHHDFSATRDKSDALQAFERALGLEKSVYQNLLQLHALAGQNNDPQFQDHIEGYLEEQVKSVKEFANWVAQLNRVGPSGQAVFIFDKEFKE